MDNKQNDLPHLTYGLKSRLPVDNPSILGQFVRIIEYSRGQAKRQAMLDQIAPILNWVPVKLIAGQFAPTYL